MNLNTPLNSVEEIRNKYQKTGYVFVDGDIVKDILQSNYGVAQEDLTQLESSGDDLKRDPTMPRTSANARFSVNYNDDIVSTLSQTSFVLTKEDGFKRKDSGQKRDFAQINEQVQNNKAFQGLMRLQADIIKNIELPISKDLVEDTSRQLSTVFQIRTIRQAGDKTDKHEGEPAPEGAHCDIGLQKGHIATIMINSKNLTQDSGISILLKADQQSIKGIIGTQYNDINPKLVQAKVQHKKPFDMLFFVDTPHALSSIEKQNTHQTATRDMILLMTRRFKDGEDQTPDTQGVSFKI